MAEATLRGLWQVQVTVASYAACFCCFTVDAEWNEVAQMYLFQWGLWEEIKDELARTETPVGLDTLVDLTICIDNQLQE